MDTKGKIRRAMREGKDALTDILGAADNGDPYTCDELHQEENGFTRAIGLLHEALRELENLQVRPLT